MLKYTVHLMQCWQGFDNNTFRYYYYYYYLYMINITIIFY